MKQKQCCLDCNGMVDITNSCIFCKAYLPKNELEVSICCGYALDPDKFSGSPLCYNCRSTFIPKSTKKPLKSTQKIGNLHKTGNWLGLEKEWNAYLDSQNRKAPYLDKDFLWWVNQFEIKNVWYENELKIADERWKRAEDKLRDLQD